MEILQVSRECPGYVSRVYVVSSPDQALVVCGKGKDCCRCRGRGRGVRSGKLGSGSVRLVDPGYNLISRGGI